MLSRLSTSAVIIRKKTFYPTSFAVRNFQEQKIKVCDHNINYLKVGNGDHKVLLLPGAMGTIWTHFKPQIEGFNKDKFTVIAWDLPGYGKSRPPEKDFSGNFYIKDAEYAIQFMKELNIPKYSILGWSDGGIIGMIQAAIDQKSVEKLVIWGCSSFILPQEIEAYKKTRSIKSWSERMRQQMIEAYGEEYAAILWVNCCDAVEALFHANKGDICSQMLKDIKCQTFIFHGEKDPLVDNVHVSYLHTHIEGSRIHLYPDGKHNVHLRYAEDFNRRVQDFLLAP